MFIRFQNKIKYEIKWKFLIYIIRQNSLSKNCNEQQIHNALKNNNCIQTLFIIIEILFLNLYSFLLLTSGDKYTLKKLSLIYWIIVNNDCVGAPKSISNGTSYFSLLLHTRSSVISRLHIILQVQINRGCSIILWSHVPYLVLRALLFRCSVML